MPVHRLRRYFCIYKLFLSMLLKRKREGRPSFQKVKVDFRKANSPQHLRVTQLPGCGGWITWTQQAFAIQDPQWNLPLILGIDQDGFLGQGREAKPAQAAYRCGKENSGEFNHFLVDGRSELLMRMCTHRWIHWKLPFEWNIPSSPFLSVLFGIFHEEESADLEVCACTILSAIGFRRCLISLSLLVFDGNDSSSSDLFQREPLK